MQEIISFPSFPANVNQIFTYRGPGEYMACAIVRRTDTRQLMAYRRLRMILGERLFREALVEALDIISHARNITSPAAWLYSFLRDEAAAASRGGDSRRVV